MKKLLTVALALAMGATLVGAFAACKTTKADDAEIAKKAIVQIRNLYAETDETETAAEYTVMAVANVDGELYTVNWSVSSDYENYANYVSVGEMNETTKKVTVSITKGPEVIAYTLKASVTVGKATETAEFKHTIPKTQTTSDDEMEATLDFTGTGNPTRTVFTDTQQVYTQNGITLTNDKGASTTKVNNATSTYHIRIYKSSSVKIEFPGMTKLVFYSETAYTGTDGKVSDYPAWLKGSLEAINAGTVTAGTVTVDEKEVPTVTLELASPLDTLEFTASAGQIRLTRLDIVAKKGGTSDADKVAGAKALLDVTQKNYTATGEYDLPAALNGATVTWAVTSDYASIEGGKLKVTSMPATETEVTLVATLKVNEATDTKNITIKLVPLALEHAGTEADPYSIADAKIMTATLAAGTTSTAEYYVKGYVIAPGTYNSDFNNFDDMYIADAADTATDADGAFLVYRPKATGDYLTAEGFNKGDLVTFKGNLQNYKKDETTLIPELLNGVCVAKVAAQRTPAQIVADAKEALELSKTTFNVSGETFDLPATKSGASLEWAVTTETDLVTISGTTLTIVSLPTAAATITITATITGGTGDSAASDTKPFTITVEPLVLEHAGTLADPFSLADVAKLGNTLANSAYYGGSTPTQVYVKGYVVKVGNWDDSYKNYTGNYLMDVYSEDATQDTAGAIQVYRIASDGTYITGETSLTKGDLITVKGYIQKYSGKVQVSNNGNNSTNPTVVDMQKAGMSDADVVAAAKAAVKLGTTYEAGEVTLPTSSNGATLEWEVMSGDCVTISGSTMTVTTPATDDATVTVKVTITKGSENDFNTFTFTVLASTKGNVDDPYTVAEIDTIISGLSSGETYQVSGVDKLVYVHGYIVAVGTEGNYGRENIKIADTADATDGIVVFGNNYDNELPKGMTLAVGDEVLVSGYLKLYADINNGNTTKEIANSTTSTTRPVIKLLNAENKLTRTLALFDDTFTVEKAGETVLPAFTVNGVTFTWELVGTPEGVTVTVADGKINVDALPSANTEVTLQLTGSLEGTENQQKTVTVTVKAPPASDEETKIYTLNTSAKTGSNNNYASNCDVELDDGTTWNVEGNATMSPWRFGGKSITNTDRKLTGKTAISGKVTKLEIEFGAASSITVNTVTLKVYSSDPTVAGATEVSSLSVSFMASETVTVTADKDWTNCYFQLVLNVTVSGTSNKFVTVPTITFWGFVA